MIQLHFVLVLWSHYKNAHLTKDKGGCAPVVDTNIQMGGVAISTENSMSQNSVADGRVAHAIDDRDLSDAQRHSQLSM